MTEKSPSEQANELRQRWNPDPVDQGFERVVGVPREPGDTRATAHTPMEELNRGFNPGDDSVDAGQKDAFSDSMDEKSLDDMTLKELQEAAERRDLPKSGTKDDLKTRISEYDESDDEEDDGDNA